ncbi:ASCH domain-containing protein [Clostridium sp. WILCCON 0269]|uniref:ASCH domain-containing protein n=1 Tax=Candidatus Clostridium eludens TaxID=3381663 RepID=A0ABW8SQE1_9CLOT
MKVLTIRQPWASLITLGEKKIETRSWRTNYRGELFIHAGKSVDKEACNEYFIKGALQKHGYTTSNFPTGVIIAKVDLVDCIAIDLGTDPGLRKAKLKDGNVIQGDEYSFGDYTPERYAWILDNIEPLKELIPAKGQLSLWEYKDLA